MTAALRLVAATSAVAALLLRAAADSLDMFCRSIVAQTVTAPDVIPEWVQEEVDLP